MILSIELT